MAGRFENRVVAVTGAAGGIGRAATERFASEGARVVAVDLESEQLAETVRAAEKLGAEVLAVAADVTNADQVRGYVAEAQRAFGGLDALFNNAGIEGTVGPFETYPLDVFERVMAVNVTGVFLGMQAAIPALRERGGGAIVNTASVAGMTGQATLPAYIASKHAVLGLTKSGAQGFGAEGIRVNAICPGPIETRMIDSIEKMMLDATPAEAGLDLAGLRQGLEASIPSARYGAPEEVAALVAFLCSDEAQYINGASITIDGALTTSTARI